MAQISVKAKLHEYIELADEKKVQAIYTLVENEIEDRSGLYDATAITSFQNTSANYFSGKIAAYPMAESLKRIREKISKLNP